MYIRRVKIKNVRGFTEVDLDLSRPDGRLAGWTVLAGRNGAGKSTLLRSMALGIAGPDSARILCTSFADWIRSGQVEATIKTNLEFLDIEGDLAARSTSVLWRANDDNREPLISGSTPGDGISLASVDTEDGFDVFVSYFFEDRPEINTLVQELQDRGIRSWLDTLHLRPGVNRRQIFEEALEKTPTLLFCIGRGNSIELTDKPSSLIRSFQAKGRTIIPVILSSYPGETRSLPAYISELVSVDLRGAAADPIGDLIWGITGKKIASIQKDSRKTTQNDLPGWFLAGYGPYRRLTGHAIDAQRLMIGPQPIARLVSLFREDSSLIESVSWLREIYLQRLENKPGASELEQTILAFLNDGLLPDSIHVEQIDSEGLWVLQHGVRLPLQELSDGYRTMAALVMDIVRHLHQTFGELQIESAKNEDRPYQRILHKGVVLIDEVDLHLHVSWQKRIGFWLKRHFPNIQFIVTTHSPFVCQAADPRGLIRLPAPGEDRPVEHVSEDLYNTVVNGSADDAVLTELFGLETPYSEESERLRERVAQLEAMLQSGKAREKDRKELSELRSRLPQTLTSDVDQALRKLAADG